MLVWFLSFACHNVWSPPHRTRRPFPRPQRAPLLVINNSPVSSALGSAAPPNQRQCPGGNNVPSGGKQVSALKQSQDSLPDHSQHSNADCPQVVSKTNISPCPNMILSRPRRIFFLLRSLESARRSLFPPSGSSADRYFQNPEAPEGHFAYLNAFCFHLPGAPCSLCMHQQVMCPHH